MRPSGLHGSTVEAIILLFLLIILVIFANIYYDGVPSSMIPMVSQSVHILSMVVIIIATIVVVFILADLFLYPAQSDDSI